MPPKRKAVSARVEPKSVPEKELHPLEPKLRRRGIEGTSEEKEKSLKNIVTTEGKKEEKISEEKITVRRKKNTTTKNEEFHNTTEGADTKVTKRKGKEDSTNGISRGKTADKEKEDPLNKLSKTKDRKKEPEERKKEKPGPSNSTLTKWDEINFTCTKENRDGQKYNLKISSWNIGGLKSWVKKDCMKYIEYENPDILCLQETKCSEAKLPEEVKSLKNYKQYWCASSKEGYAGVGLLTIQEPLKVTYGIRNTELDEDGRCITAEYKEYYVICVYVPNAGRKLVTLPKRLHWNAAFKDYVKSLDNKKPVIICGDMNVAHREIDLARPTNNTKNAGFTKEERDGMTDFLQDGYVDTFRKLYPDRTGVYTFWTYMANARAKNVGWRLDYFIISGKIMDKVCDSVMRSEILGSDHCPITLFINI